MEQKELDAIKPLVTRFQEQPWDYLAFELARFVPDLIAAQEAAWAEKAALQKAIEDRIKGLEAYMRDFPSDQFGAERLDNWREFRSLMEAK